MTQKPAPASAIYSIWQSTLLFLTAAALTSCTSFLERPGTLLGEAAHQGHLAEIRRLVALGTDPNAFDASGQTALHWAARGGHLLGPHTCRRDVAGRAEIVDALLDLGADINAIDRRATIPGAASGLTPLHVALHHQQFAIAARLLHRGANTGIRTGQGQTVLSLAEEAGAPKELLAQLIAAK